MPPRKPPPPPRKGSYLWWSGGGPTRTPSRRQEGCRLGRRVLCPPFRTVARCPRPEPLSLLALLLARGSAWGTHPAAGEGRDCVGPRAPRPCLHERLQTTGDGAGGGRLAGIGPPLPAALLLPSALATRHIEVPRTASPGTRPQAGSQPRARGPEWLLDAAAFPAPRAAPGLASEAAGLEPAFRWDDPHQMARLCWRLRPPESPGGARHPLGAQSSELAAARPLGRLGRRSP